MIAADIHLFNEPNLAQVILSTCSTAQNDQPSAAINSQKHYLYFTREFNNLRCPTQSDK